jgi:hypothetical protein
MKKMYPLSAITQSTKTSLLLFFLSYGTLAFAQPKSEFGFVVKFGNYAIPSERNDLETMIANTAKGNLIIHQTGSIYTVGIWQDVPLGHYFRLSGEFLYRSTFFAGRQKVSFSILDGSSSLTGYSFQSQKVNESSISMPIKIHFLFKKGGKLSLAIGGGISHLFYSNVTGHSGFRLDDASLAVEPDENYSAQLTNWDDFDPVLSLTAGLHYRIDKKTAFGLEYNFEKTSTQYLYALPFTFAFCKCACDCFGNSSQLRPNMNSFSVSLRHNILD